MSEWNVESNEDVILPKNDDAQQKLMEILVSRTLRKYGINKEEASLSEQEKINLREAVKLLQSQVNTFMHQKADITEEDVNPITKVYNPNEQ